MSAYYYLVATLPALSMDAGPSLDYASFRALCAEHLSEADVRVLDVLVEGKGSGNGFVRAWRDRDGELRNEVARKRAPRVGGNAESCLRDVTSFDMRVEKVVADAFAQATPLDREKALDRFRWQVIEELQGFDTFSFSAVLAYALKVQIAARWGAVDEEKGRMVADTQFGVDAKEILAEYA